MDSFARDLRHAVRNLLRTPGFAVITVFTLALGIGANTAIFSVVNAVILRPLAYPRPERLVYDHDDDGVSGQPPFHVTITFEEVGGKTRLTNRMVFDSAETCAQKKGFGAVELGQQTLDRLGEHLAGM